MHDAALALAPVRPPGAPHEVEPVRPGRAGPAEGEDHWEGLRGLVRVVAREHELDADLGRERLCPGGLVEVECEAGT